MSKSVGDFFEINPSTAWPDNIITSRILCFEENASFDEVKKLESNDFYESYKQREVGIFILSKLNKDYAEKVQALKVESVKYAAFYKTNEDSIKKGDDHAILEERDQYINRRRAAKKAINAIEKANNIATLPDPELKDRVLSPFYIKIGGDELEGKFNSKNLRFTNLTFKESSNPDNSLIFGKNVSLDCPSFSRCRFEGVDFSGVADFHTWKFHGCTFVDCLLPEVVKESQFVVSSGEFFAGAAGAIDDKKRECKFLKSKVASLSLEEITLEKVMGVKKVVKQVPSPDPNASKGLRISMERLLSPRNMESAV